MENNELYHFGINGMKWGIRRYQNPDGSRTEEGKLHYGYKFIDSEGRTISPREAKRVAKLEKKRLKKEAKEAKKREKREKEKKRALEKGSAEDILKFKDEFTIEEKQAALRRLQADSSLLSIANQEAERNSRVRQQKSFSTKVEKFSRGINTAGQLVGNLSNLYNNSAKVVNAFGGTALPIIGENKKAETRSMQIAKLALEEYNDMSYNELKEMDIEKLNDLNKRLSSLAALENIRYGKKK